MQSQARVSTKNAVQYLGQLCAHFQHKIPAQWAKESATKATGSITFPVGVCTLEAADEVLLMTADAADGASLQRLEEVVTNHLARFAFRDTPEVSWAALEAALVE